MITFSKFGNYGRLGNQLFQYASMIGIADKYNTSVVLPRCDFADYLENEPTISDVTGKPVREQEFTFNMEQFADAEHSDIDITGWLQSEKYWEHCKDKVKQSLSIHPRELFQSKTKYSYSTLKAWGDKPTIAISIRRGDYVNNPNYDLLDADYYYLALLEHFPDWRNYNILIFSDDIPYCKIHFQCLPNVHFIEDLNPMEQLILGSMCDHFIIANSTFSWWMAYLGEDEDTNIIRPAYLFAGELLANNSDADFWPERWTKFDHKGKKLDLFNTTFLVPCTVDSEDRKENFSLVTKNIARYFNTVLVTGSPLNEVGKFHRTAWLNALTENSFTPYVINYDCDILTPPLQLWYAVEMLRRGEADMVYPYDGRFARVPRTWVPTIQRYNDVGMLKGYEFVGCRMGDAPSVGGVVAYNKEKFIESGGENEKMVSYAPEDVERFYRWNKLGYNVRRVNGCCYHIDHQITTNSSTSHPYYKANEAELSFVKSLSGKELRSYVNLWGYFAQAPIVHQ